MLLRPAAWAARRIRTLCSGLRWCKAAERLADNDTSQPLGVRACLGVAILRAGGTAGADSMRSGIEAGEVVSGCWAFGPDAVPRAARMVDD